MPQREKVLFMPSPRVTGAMKAKGMKLTTADCSRSCCSMRQIVVLVPGTPFGAPGYVRLSFACSIEELEKAVSQNSRRHWCKIRLARPEFKL